MRKRGWGPRQKMTSLPSSLPLHTMSSQIQFRFIRTAHAWTPSITEKDDVVRIKYLAPNRFRASYMNGDDCTGTSGIMNEQGVWNYVRALVRTLHLDVGEPLVYVLQVDMPLMPSVMFRVANLAAGSSTYDALLDALDVQLDAWSMGGRIVQMKTHAMKSISHASVPSLPAPRDARAAVRAAAHAAARAAAHAAEEEAEDEYADMPALVSMATPSVRRRHLFSST